MKGWDICLPSLVSVPACALGWSLHSPGATKNSLSCVWCLGVEKNLDFWWDLFCFIEFRMVQIPFQRVGKFGYTCATRHDLSGFSASMAAIVQHCKLWTKYKDDWTILKVAELARWKPFICVPFAYLASLGPVDFVKDFRIMTYWCFLCFSIFVRTSVFVHNEEQKATDSVLSCFYDDISVCIWVNCWPLNPVTCCVRPHYACWVSVAQCWADYACWVSVAQCWADYACWVSVAQCWADYACWVSVAQCWADYACLVSVVVAVKPGDAWYLSFIKMEVQGSSQIMRRKFGHQTLTVVVVCQYQVPSHPVWISFISTLLVRFQKLPPPHPPRKANNKQTMKTPSWCSHLITLMIHNNQWIVMMPSCATWMSKAMWDGLAGSGLTCFMVRWGWLLGDGRGRLSEATVWCDAVGDPGVGQTA